MQKPKHNHVIHENCEHLKSGILSKEVRRIPLIILLTGFFFLFFFVGCVEIINIDFEKIVKHNFGR